MSEIARYKFEGNSNDSVGSNNGTDTSILYTTGKIGQAAKFDGLSSKITIGNINLPADFSLAFWIKFPVNDGNFGAIVSGSGGVALFVYNGLAGLVGNITIPCTNINFGFTIPAPLNWNHIVLVRRGTTHEYYLNGLLVATAENPPANYNFVSIGRTDLYSWSMSETLDDLRFFNNGLTTAEVTALYKSYATSNFFPFFFS